MNERSRQLEHRFELPLLIGAILTIPAFVVEESSASHALRTTALVVNYAVWGAFVLELVVMLAVVSSRRAWLAAHPLELIIAVLTPPFLVAALQPIRVLRLVRYLRLLRVVPLARRLRRLQKAVMEARAAAAGLDDEEAGTAYSRVLSPAIDRAMSQLLRQAAADSARLGLEEAFGSAWLRLGNRSQDLLIAAEVLRGDLEAYSSLDPGFDFATAVHAYSRALENAVLEQLFMPFHDSALPLPADTGSTSRDRSLAALRRLRDHGRLPELGTMAHCLKNVGCRLADEPENGFVTLLDERLLDRQAFCDSFPSPLLRYGEIYRNGAAHVQVMDRDKCVEARALLIEEPPRLLHALIAALR